MPDKSHCGSSHFNFGSNVTSLMILTKNFEIHLKQLGFALVVGRTFSLDVSNYGLWLYLGLMTWNGLTIPTLIVVGWEFSPCLGDNWFDIMMQFVSPLLFVRCDLCPSSYLELLRRIVTWASLNSYWLTQHVAKNINYLYIKLEIKFDPKCKCNWYLYNISHVIIWLGRRLKCLQQIYYALPFYSFGCYPFGFWVLELCSYTSAICMLQSYPLWLKEWFGCFFMTSTSVSTIFQPTPTEPIFGRKARQEFAHIWNKSVDNTFGPAIEYLSSRGW